MEVIAVIAVGARPEHGHELAARILADLAQEFPLIAVAAPALFDVDVATVGKRKARYVDGVAEAMLAHPRTALVVAGAAGI